MSAEQIKQERTALKEEYGKLFDAVSEILFRHDPIGINFESNTDKYDPEAGTILPRLKECQDVFEVRKVVFQEFIRWFDEDNVGSEEQYEEISQEIWSHWQKFK
jgi:hypothetical protein